MKQIFGIYDPATKQYTDGSEGVYSFESGGVMLRVFGRVRVNDSVNDGGEIISLFKKHGTDFTMHANGVYIALFFDSDSGRVTVFHDRTTSAVTLHYTEQKNKIYIGTSVKRIIDAAGIKPSFNDDALEEFLLNGFLYTRKTLLSEIYKLEAFRCLVIDSDGISQQEVNYPLEILDKGEALGKFDSTLSAAVDSCTEDLDEVCLPLSSGFDSNYICCCATENSGVPVTAFSVGGKFGKNELPVVENNVQYYNNLTLKTALTDSNSLKYLPDIVWRLEGDVYENGLFLQYELANLVVREGKNCLVCGECADQVMNINYLDESRLLQQQPEEGAPHYEFAECPFVFSSFLILKKNGILANSFGIETRYPFLDNDVVSVGYALRYINGRDKRVHTANCREKLPPEVIANMKKIGGSTDCRSLFENENEMKDFIRKIENCEFYREHADVINAVNAVPAEEQSGVDRLKTKIINAGKKLTRAQSDSFWIEMKLRKYMSVAYLALFNELFASGKYDMTAESIEDGLDKFFN